MSDGRIRLFTAAQAIYPIGHVRKIVVTNERRRNRLVSMYSNITSFLTLGRFCSLVFLRRHPHPTRTSFSTNVIQGACLSHNSHETVTAATETRGVADHKAFGILEQRLERVRILTTVVPGEYST